MTRNNERAAQVRDAIGPPPTAKAEESYQLASWAKRYAAVMKGPPLEWARSIHSMWRNTLMGPRRDPLDGDKVGKHVEDKYRAAAQRSICRGENELKLRSLIRATRMLSASPDPKDNKMGGELSRALEMSWGIKRAYETVSEGEGELYDQLREQWGEVQLPPPDATVNKYSADELLIKAAVRRILG